MKKFILILLFALSLNSFAEDLTAELRLINSNIFVCYGQLNIIYDAYNKKDYSSIEKYHKMLSVSINDSEKLLNKLVAKEAEKPIGDGNNQLWFTRLKEMNIELKEMNIILKKYVLLGKQEDRINFAERNKNFIEKFKSVIDAQIEKLKENE